MKRKGQSLVETTLVLVAFVSLLLGVVDIGQTLVMRGSLADRVHTAARWGALHPYDPAAIRNMVLYGAAEPRAGDTRFPALQESDVVVRNPGCPGPDCRISVAVRSHGIEMSEPVELSD